MLDIKIPTEIKSTLIGPLLDRAQTRRESLSLSISQQKPPKVKSNRKRTKKEYSRTTG